MASLFDTARNFSLYTVNKPLVPLQLYSLTCFDQIPAAWLVAFLPHAYAASLSKKFDNKSPRTYVGSLQEDQSIDQATRDRIVRSEGAQSNGFENLGLFAAAVVAGNVAGLPAQTLNTLTGAYIASRVLYNYIYVTNTSDAAANLRGVVFVSGVGLVWTLFIKSGNVLREKAANLL
ncbi:hypothetical protein QTJ16_006329 [Diplocarpon rosae]|uniref:Uncharacterized protein n=1 Tax=Diplocarpon rosae TaxID=946125 RepID=A0AAD9WD19_9HELO|nr:hypothetical protein QTJ16_006329 [Diplocarpon rosae]PBP28006.1 membrane protein [Diplocarpon rosae]